METIKEWIESIRQRQSIAKITRIRRDAERAIQVREFDGILYVAVHDVPLVAEDEIKLPIADAVRAVRTTYVNYQLHRI